MNDQKTKTVFDECNQLRAEIAALTAELEAQKASFRDLSKTWVDVACRLHVAEAELEAARKVADAAADWADACRASDAGAGGSSEYLRAWEVLLRATVREYRAHLEAQAVMSRPGTQRGMEQLEEMEGMSSGD